MQCIKNLCAVFVAPTSCRSQARPARGIWSRRGSLPIVESRTSKLWPRPLPAARNGASDRLFTRRDDASDVVKLGRLLARETGWDLEIVEQARHA